jgi:hypothetical protein
MQIRYFALAILLMQTACSTLGSKSTSVIALQPPAESANANPIVVNCKIYGPLDNSAHTYQTINSGQVEFDASLQPKTPFDQGGGCTPNSVKKVIGANTSLPVEVSLTSCGQLDPYLFVKIRPNGFPFSFRIGPKKDNRVILDNNSGKRFPASEFGAASGGQFEFLYVDCYTN